MVRSGKVKWELEKKNEEPLNCHSRNISEEWEIHGSNFVNSSMRSIPLNDHVEVCKGDMIESTSCSSVPLMNSFCPTIWDLPTSSQNLGFADINVQHNASNLHLYGARASGLHHLGAGMERSFGISCSSANPVFEGGMFVPNVPGMLPQSLAQIPADSGFIERAARFSCFSGGNLGDMMNPFSIHEPVNRYSNGLKSMSGVQPQDKGTTMAANSEGAPLRIDHEDPEGSPHKNERKLGSPVKSRDEAKQGGALEMGSDLARFNGHGGEENPEGTGAEPSVKGLGSKKRKRICQSRDGEVDESKEVQQVPTETTKLHTETQLKEDQTNPSTITKIGGKNCKQGAQTSDPPKEEYIHIRARKGQATNSHSLAERVRREKISERMKFLQDLVPGCNKVTGKAVMLDEIINYVQSLQRQVEFLSMKLATVNPRMDINIESLLAKDIFQSRAGPSSLAFQPDMTLQYPSLHPPPSLIQSCLPDVGISSNSLRRSISSQYVNMVGGYKEPTSHVASAWEDELNNVIGMELNSTSPLSSQDHSASVPPGHMKAEL